MEVITLPKPHPSNGIIPYEKPECVLLIASDYSPLLPYFYPSILHAPQPILTAMQYRHTAASVKDLHSTFLSREIDYAKSSTTVYAKVLKEVQGVKGDISALDEKSLKGLSTALSSSREAARKLAGLVE